MSGDTITMNVTCLRQEVKVIHKQTANKHNEILHNLTKFSEDTANKARTKTIRQHKHSVREKNKVFRTLKFIRKKLMVVVLLDCRSQNHCQR